MTKIKNVSRTKKRKIAFLTSGDIEYLINHGELDITYGVSLKRLGSKSNIKSRVCKRRSK